MLSDVVVIGPGFSQEQDRRYTDLPCGWWVQKIYTRTSLHIYVIRFDLVHLDSANLDAQLGRRAQTKTTEIAISMMRSIRPYEFTLSASECHCESDVTFYLMVSLFRVNST